MSVPFSSSLTLDDDRALLPPMHPRPPVYCYYEATSKQSQEEKDAESGILLTWRRAWWAQGFRPIVVSAADAMNNPTYDEFQRLDIGAELKHDLMRWLAWGAVGGGLLSEYTMFPMAYREDPLLSYLRRGEYPRLSKWRFLDNGLLAGNKANINLAIRAAISVSNLRLAKTVVTALTDEAFEIDNSSTALAYYSPEIVRTKYAKLITQDNATTLRNLDRLINTHLLLAWQNNFPDGIEVLKPHPQHTTAMISGALKLAQHLASCPKSSLPSSCPPNLPKCSPCVASPTRVITPARFRNSSRIFTIGTVPHPWTLALLKNQKELLNITWIRHESPRDSWLAAVTQGLLGSGVSANRRVMRFKVAVASEYALARSLWLIAEKEMPSSIDWHFGFALPEKSIDTGKSQSPVPADRLPKQTGPDWENGPVASEEDVAKELLLLQNAKKVVSLPKSAEQSKLRASLEAWNMADTEAWKFTQAFQSRRLMERESLKNDKTG